jgi:hypothetical protein
VPREILGPIAQTEQTDLPPVPVPPYRASPKFKDIKFTDVITT